MSAGFENLGDAIRVTRPEGISDAKWARFRTGMERIVTGHLPWCDDHQGVGDTRRLVGEIRAEMARQGITQQRLAEGTDISTAGMSRRLSGGVDLTFHEVETIAAALGVKVADLIERAERPSGHVEVDGTAVRYADDYYRTVVDWPAWDLGKGMIGQPSSFGLMVEGGQQPCVRVVADGACGKLPTISTRETAHELALAILELSKHLPE